MIQLQFETFNVPSFYVGIEAVLEAVPDFEAELQKAATTTDCNHSCERALPLPRAAVQAVLQRI
jgi:actin-related protein